MTAIPEDQRPLSDVVAQAERGHGRIDVERDGRMVASVVSSEYLESLEETVEIASDPELVAAIEAGDDDITAGRTFPLDDVKAELGLR